MRPIALCILLAFVASTAAARTITSSQGNANEKSAAGVAGTAVAAGNSSPQQDRSSAQPSRKTLKKSKVKTPPAMHDPN